MKNSGEFLKTKSDFKIINDEGDGDGSIQITNETDAFVKLKDQHGENLLVHIEKTIKFNGCKSGAKFRLISKATVDAVRQWQFLLEENMETVKWKGEGLTFLSYQFSGSAGSFGQRELALLPKGTG
ncbi:hypothetical protein Tco_1435055 [Tanacetum coccineum]